MERTWIGSLGEFMDYADRYIETEGERLIDEQRENNKFLIERATTMSKTAQDLIQQCRLFLRVQNLSDICNAAGTWVEKEYLVGKRYRGSSIDWPKQGHPALRAWKAWRRLLATYCQDSTGKLLQENKMGKWTKTHQLWMWTGKRDTVKNLLGQIYKATGRGQRPTATMIDSTECGKMYPADVTRAAGQIKIIHISQGLAEDNEEEHTGLGEFMRTLPQQYKQLLGNIQEGSNLRKFRDGRTKICTKCRI